MSNLQQSRTVMQAQSAQDKLVMILVQVYEHETWYIQLEHDPKRNIVSYRAITDLTFDLDGNCFLKMTTYVHFFF